MPKNVVREERTSQGLSPDTTDVKPFQEDRHDRRIKPMDRNQIPYLAKKYGAHDALKNFGVHTPSTPATNEDAVVPKKENRNIPDAGTGYATSGAQYGADIRK